MFFRKVILCTAFFGSFTSGGLAFAQSAAETACHEAFDSVRKSLADDLQCKMGAASACGSAINAGTRTECQAENKAVGDAMALQAACASAAALCLVNSVIGGAGPDTSACSSDEEVPTASCLKKDDIGP